MAKAASGTRARRSGSGGSAKKAPAAPTGTRVTIRHYCQGIGDCHLLGFPTEDGDKYWMLIDCGVHSAVSGGSDKMDKIVADIAKQTGGRIDVLVVTHEHTDHVSGFRTAAEHFATLTVGDVWMGWTEDPMDQQALQLDKFKQQAMAALETTSRRLNRAIGISPHLSALRDGLDAVVGFNFGMKGERVRGSREAAKNLAKGRVKYWEPTDPPITIAELPNLRIYVLGPPRDPKLLGLTERQSEMYTFASSPGWPITQALSSAFAVNNGGADNDGEYDRPFDFNVGAYFGRLAGAGAAAVPADTDHVGAFAYERYFGPVKPESADRNERDQSWRRIDHDWLGVSADLAMQLDNRTNNTSLALAFEFIDTKRVLLFAADAQVGSWLSWQERKWKVDDETVTGPDLLARTVHYKVAHHGSHNATLKEKGLELMTSKDLSAFIPTNKVDAASVGWNGMPFGSILTALAERCRGRVIRADDAWIKDANGRPDFDTPGGSILGLDYDKDDGLWVELQLA